LSTSTKLSGFALTQRDRGRFRCPYCETDLELSPSSILAQIAFIIPTSLLLWVPLVRMLRQGGAPWWVAFAALVAGCSLIAMASYLWLGRWRVRRIPSILAR